MARNTSFSFITPIKNDGTEPIAGADAAFGTGRGVYTLEANSTYYYILGGSDAGLVSSHFKWDAEIIITKMSVEDCNDPDGETSNFAHAGGDWIPEEPTDAEVAIANVAGVTTTDGTVAATGGAQAGCMFHIGDTGARRTRIAVAVGATGGQMRCSEWGKE